MYRIIQKNCDVNKFETSLPLIKSQQNSCRQFLLTIINQKILEPDDVITNGFYAGSSRVFKPTE